MSTTASLQAVSAHVEALIQALHLREIAVEPYFAHAKGEIAGHEVTMTSRRYTGAAFDTLTVAYLHNLAGELLSVTVSGIPVAETGLPILGLDYVGFRGTLSLVALDLCPVDSAVWQKQCAPFLRDLHQSAQSLVQRKIPGFTQGIFSPQAIFAAAVDAQQCDHSVILAQQLLEQARLIYAIAQPYGTAKSGLQQIQRWKRAMQGNKKEHSALSRIFGEAFTEKYLKDFLFFLEASAVVSEPVAISQPNA